MREDVSDDPAEWETHRREVRESVRFERRLLAWEVVALLLVVVFVLVRQRWLL